MLVVVAAIGIAAIGYQSTSNLYTTSAAYGGQGTRLSMDFVTTFFANVSKKSAPTSQAATTPPKCKAGQTLTRGVCV